MIKEMNKEIFSQFFDMALNEIKQKEEIPFVNDAFIISPIVEEGKISSGKDEVMRLNILNKARVSKHIYTRDEVISMLTFFDPLVPIWIDVEYIPDYDEGKSVFRLSCSLRLRKPSLLKNQESGHPPFRVITKEYL